MIGLVRRRAAAFAAFAAFAELGCGPDAAERERCYDAAEADAQRRVDVECPGRFDTCPAADAIVDELRRAQEACR